MEKLKLTEIKEVLREWKNSEIIGADLGILEEIREFYELVSLTLTASEEIEYFNQKLKEEYGENTEARITCTVNRRYDDYVNAVNVLAYYSFDIPHHTISRTFSNAEDSYNALCSVLEILGVKGEKHGN